MTGAEGMAIAVSRAESVPETEIARKAFELFCARGCQHGSDLDDWLSAERELRAASGRPRRRTVRKTTTLD